MKPWHVYMALCADNTLYTGVTVDLAKRMQTHNAGQGAKYTRARLPIRLVWSEIAKSESAAKKREAEIKKWSRAKKLAIIRSSTNLS